jgi:hypothetical protein
MQLITLLTDEGAMHARIEVFGEALSQIGLSGALSRHKAAKKSQPRSLSKVVGIRGNVAARKGLAQGLRCSDHISPSNSWWNGRLMVVLNCSKSLI